MTSPALDLLLGPHAPDVLTAALAEYGGELEHLQPGHVNVRPSGAATVMYWTVVRRADGSRTTEILAATTGGHIPAGAAVVAGEHLGAPVEVGIWRWPQDPALPALAAAADPGVLCGLGLSATDVSDVQVRAYRPAQRAVLELHDGHRTWFLKVLRPSAVAQVRARHDLASPHLPVPPVAACTGDGLIVLPEAPGTPLRDVLADGGELPPPDALEALLDALPAELAAMPPRRSHLELVDEHAAALRWAAAGEADVLAELAELVDALHTVEHETGPVVPVHGDFYEGQLLTGGGRITGLVDLDTAGAGERIDEWAMLLAHLSGLDLEDRWHPTAGRYATEVLAHADRRVAPRQLRQRTAAALLGLATGPFRVQHPQWPEHTVARIELAKKWLASAG
ncbi:phosphotransferase family protein [Mycolicibacterium pulveris]|uniref:phosphotransferase family protein n=1 Tax=Mycolicibacterium pulveris TaxID=36813 RepID=UPI003CF2C227